MSKEIKWRNKKPHAFFFQERIFLFTSPKKRECKKVNVHNEIVEMIMFTLSKKLKRTREVQSLRQKQNRKNPFARALKIKECKKRSVCENSQKLTCLHS